MSYFNAMRCYELNGEMFPVSVGCKAEIPCYILNKADNPLYEILSINQLAEKGILNAKFIEKEKLP